MEPLRRIGAIMGVAGEPSGIRTRLKLIRTIH